MVGVANVPVDEEEEDEPVLVANTAQDNGQEKAQVDLPPTSVVLPGTDLLLRDTPVPHPNKALFADPGGECVAALHDIVFILIGVFTQRNRTTP